MVEVIQMAQQTSRTTGLLVVLLLAGACMPQPAGRTSPAPPPTQTAVPSATATSTPAGPTPLPSFVRPTATPLPTFLTYVVRSGDTLSSIARTFSTTPVSIAYWNRAAYPSLDPESEAYQPDRIRVGWALAIMPGVEVDISDLPDASEIPTPPAGGASPSPVPTAPTPAMTPGATASGVSDVVRHGPREVSTVALTFDMGGRLDPALDILAWLVDHDVPATIFPTGKSGTTTAIGSAALEVASEHRDLFDLGNHTWSHPDLRDLDDAAIRDQLERTETAVLEAIGRSTKPWFRPPFGGLDDQIPVSVGAAGWGYTVMWDVDTIDWKPEDDGGPTADEIVAKVVGNARGGSIVLMHLGGYNTLEALPGILGGLRAKGLTPVTLGTMFGR